MCRMRRIGSSTTMSPLRLDSASSGVVAVGSSLMSSRNVLALKSHVRSLGWPCWNASIHHTLLNNVSVTLETERTQQGIDISEPQRVADGDVAALAAHAPALRVH